MWRRAGPEFQEGAGGQKRYQSKGLEIVQVFQACADTPPVAIEHGSGSARRRRYRAPILEAYTPGSGSIR